FRLNPLSFEKNRIPLRIDLLFRLFYGHVIDLYQAFLNIFLYFASGPSAAVCQKLINPHCFTHVLPLPFSGSHFMLPLEIYGSRDHDTQKRHIDQQYPGKISLQKPWRRLRKYQRPDIGSHMKQGAGADASCDLQKIREHSTQNARIYRLYEVHMVNSEKSGGYQDRRACFHIIPKPQVDQPPEYRFLCNGSDDSHPEDHGQDIFPKGDLI